MRTISRRSLLSAGAASLGTGAIGAPVIWTRADVKPAVVSSANGNQFKNGGEKTGVQIAFEMIVQGKDVLDAVIACVNINELDPRDASVGYGGLPNADGVVQLDSCCMHGPRKWAGGVAALEGIRTPSKVAKAVAELTDHHLLVGKGAQQFARTLGFAVEDDLNTETSRRAWLEWKRRIDPEHYLAPGKRVEKIGNRETESLGAAEGWSSYQKRGIEASRQMALEGRIDPEHLFGTINCNGINSKGEICGVTTTSGLAFKIPGRVGDSPILGAGLYVDGEIGAAGSTGRGEANIFNLCSFMIVEEMRRGAHPKDAGIAALKRIKANTVEKRLLNSGGNPNFNVNFYVLNARGQYAGVALYGSRFAVCTEDGPKTLPVEALLPGKAEG